MKEVKTKIPNNEIKGNYALMHVDTFKFIIDYLDDLDRIEKGCLEENQLESISDIVDEIHNELSGLRKL